MPAKLSEYRKIIAEHQYWSATIAIRRCAELVNDPKTKALVSDGEIKQYVRDIENPQLPYYEQLRSLELLSRDYPERAKKYAKRLQELRNASEQKVQENERNFAARSSNVRSPESEACVRAIMSSMGTSTQNYTDKMAYEAHVRENCKGFKLP